MQESRLYIPYEEHHFCSSASPDGQKITHPSVTSAPLAKRAVKNEIF
jgi:hypothetical protein